MGIATNPDYTPDLILPAPRQKTILVCRITRPSIGYKPCDKDSWDLVQPKGQLQSLLGKFESLVDEKLKVAVIRNARRDDFPFCCAGAEGFF